MSSGSIKTKSPFRRKAVVGAFRLHHVIVRCDNGILWNCNCVACGIDCKLWETELPVAKCENCEWHKKRVSKGPPQSKDPLYAAWRNMVQRCTNPDHDAWNNYGGRGISVCEIWRRDFLAFAKYMGPRPTPQHTIDRWPNNNGNYEPGNVRWATWIQQMNNRRNCHADEFRCPQCSATISPEAIQVFVRHSDPGDDWSI